MGRSGAAAAGGSVKVFLSMVETAVDGDKSVNFTCRRKPSCLQARPVGWFDALGVVNRRFNAVVFDRFQHRTAWQAPEYGGVEIVEGAEPDPLRRRQRPG